MDAAKPLDPKMIGKASLTITLGVSAGWIAGILQVLVAQAEAHPLGVRERADIGPHFVRQAAQHAGSPLSKPMQWLSGGVFHFEYAASRAGAERHVQRWPASEHLLHWPAALTFGYITAFVYRWLRERW